MNITYRKSHSSVYPELLDTTSSKTSVYIRKNVEEKTEEDPTSGETRTVFEYDEACLSKAEYALYLVSEKAGADNVDCQLAIAELAETMEQSAIDIEMAIAELAEAVLTE